MKGSTKRWSLAVAAAALLMVPAPTSAQTPPQTPPATQPTTPAQPPSATEPNAAAQEHLAKATAALNDIQPAALNTRAKAQVAEVKRRISALEQMVAANDKASATGTAKGNANWGTEVAAIDKTLTALLGPEATTGSAPPAPTGTAGADPKTKDATPALDEATRASLTQVRTHLTAFATAMAVKKGPSSTAPSAEPAATPSSATPSSATPSSATPSSAVPSSGMPQGAPTQPPPTPTGTSGTTPAAQAPETPQAAQPDAQTARRHLTEARNTLSALTQLPAASQLTGEARTQVAQLIANFNELITTQSEWRGSFAKVSANLTSLIGPDPGGVPDPTAGSGTTGAVGTSGGGTPGLDPTIQAKLVELRRNLAEFEKAAGGTAGPAATSATAPPTDPASPATATPPSATPPGSNPPAGTPPSATPPATTPSPATPSAATPSAATPSDQAAGNAEVMRHVAAIEALLKSEDDSGGLTLTKVQVEQLRAHWAAIRQALEKR